jgi:translocator protein
MFNMKKIFLLIACLFGPLIIGSISGYATASNINSWFVNIIKPSFNPPNYLFAPVWTILYLLMGVGLYLVLLTPKSAQRSKAILIFSIQLFLNFCWSILFFKFHLLGIAFIEILLLWLSIATMIHYFKSINITAAYLQIPYLCWVSFAGVLNASIWWINL